MNKIIDNKSNVLRICAGNDFSILVQITEYDTETGAWVNYDLSAVSDVHMCLIADNGKRINLPVTVNSNGTASAPIQAAYLQKTTYGVELTWLNENLNRRTYAPCLLQIVTTTAESTSNIAEYESNDAYHFNIKMEADVAILSIGKISDEYITESELQDELEPYINEDELETVLENYATKSSLDDYVTNSSLSTTLEDYATKSSLEDYATKSSLDDYVTNNALSSTLDDYATKQYVDDELANIDLSEYYTKSEVDTTLNSYGTSLFSVMGTNVTSNIKSQHIQLKNSSNNTLSDIAINAFHKKDTQSGWEITPRNEIGLIELSTVETIYNTVDNVNNILSDYITSTSLNSTLNDYITNSALSTTLSDYATISSLDDYVTNSALSTTLGDYALETDMTAAQGDISSLDTRVTTLENNPQVPSNVVTSDDGNEIVCLTQAEYDALEQAQTLDPDVFYYITDATSNYVTNSSLTTTLSNYATKNYVDTAVSQVQPDTSNLVTLNSTQTISGTKTFSGNCFWTAESKFGHSNIPNNNTLMNTDIATGVNKSGMFVRPQFLQGFIGQVLAPMNNYTNSSSGQFDIQQGVIKFQTVNAVSGQQPSSLSTLAKIDSNGIYEGTTLLSNKYAQINDVPTATSQLTNDSGFITLNDIPQVSGVSEEDWDNANEAIAQELLDNRLAHLSINDNFNNYYTKTESDSRYATTSWAVSQTDNERQNQAIAAAFASSVQSTSVHNIWAGSQNDYDAITTKDTNTLYIIL